MTARVTPLVLLAFALALTGCRDTLVDEPLPAGPEEEENESSARPSIYLKGATELRVGETRNYRAEPVAQVVQYRWTISGGTGEIRGTSPNDLYRVYDITGVSEGPVELQVVAVGPSNEILGVGEIRIIVR